MPVNARLQEILVCPESKKTLIYFQEEAFLFCPDSRLKYRVVADVPIMLIEEAERVDGATAKALMKAAASKRSGSGR